MPSFSSFLKRKEDSQNDVQERKNISDRLEDGTVTKL